MDKRYGRLSAVDEVIAKVLTDAERLLLSADQPASALPARLLIEPDALVSTARAMNTTFDELAAEMHERPVAMPYFRGAMHLRDQMIKSSWSLWMVSDFVATGSGRDLAQFCNEVDPDHRKKPALRSNPSLGVKETMERAVATRHALSVAKTMLEMPTVLIPSRLSFKELGAASWDFEAEYPRGIRRHFDVNVLFEAPLEFHRPGAFHHDRSVERVASTAADALEAISIEQPREKMTVVADGMMLHGPSSPAHQPSVTLLLRIDHPELRGADGPGSVSSALTMELDDFSMVTTVTRSVETVLTHGEFTAVPDGPLPGTRLKDQSAMRLGRAMTGIEPVHTPGFSPT